MNLTSTAFVIGLLYSNLTFASDWDEVVHIDAIIPDYMPDQLKISVDANLGTCSSGGWLNHFGKGSDQATKRASLAVIYSSFLAAMLANKPVRLIGNNNNCEIDTIQILQ